MDVRVEGKLAKVLYEIDADLVVYYDDNSNEDRKIHATVVETTVIDIKTVNSIQNRNGHRIDEITPEDPAEKHKTLYYAFIVACVIFFGTVILTAIDVSIKLIKTRRAKARGTTTKAKAERIY